MQGGAALTRYKRRDISVRLQHSERAAERELAVLHAEKILAQAKSAILRREIDAALDEMLKLRRTQQ